MIYLPFINLSVNYQLSTNLMQITITLSYYQWIISWLLLIITLSVDYHGLSTNYQGLPWITINYHVLSNYLLVIGSVVPLYPGKLFQMIVCWLLLIL